MNCLFSVFMNSQCGATQKQGKTVSTPLLNCRRDVSRHLQSLGASGAQGHQSHVQVSEIDLIRNRAGLFMYSSDYVNRMTICPLHRKLSTLSFLSWLTFKTLSSQYTVTRLETKSTYKVLFVWIYLLIDTTLSMNRRATNLYFYLDKQFLYVEKTYCLGTKNQFHKA